MKQGMKIVMLSVLLTSHLFLVYSQSESNIDVSDTTKTKREVRKSNRALERKQLKPHVYITTNATYAQIQSQLSFEHESKLFRIQIDLEEHLGLESSKWFFNTNIIYRITPRSGIFVQYYGLSRSSPITLEEDIVFEEDTLKAGTLVAPFFDTRVFSLGYLYSILKEEKSFLGVYFNVYVMKIKTGFSSEVFGIDERVEFFAPLPNFGFAMTFNLTDWLILSGNIGVFFASIEGYSGAIHDLTATLSFNPKPWFGINLGMTVFDVSAEIPDRQFKTVIDYTFSGPTMGLTFRF
jgi:hypothetical protein